MTIGKLAQRDSEGKFLYDDDGNYVWCYEADDIEITEEEWESLSMFDESYINFNHLEYYSKEEIINVLSTY